MDQLQATKNELHETKQSLTELLDEVVYFEQQVNVATTRGDSIARVLSTSNASHVETVHCLISYAKALSKGFMDETSSSHATALRVLRDTSNDQSNAAAALADLNVTGCIPGWTLNGAEPLDLLPAPSFNNNNNNNNHNHSQSMDTPGMSTGGGGRVRMTRSGSVLAETMPNGGYSATPSNANYTDLRINELVAALEAEQKTTNDLRHQLNNSNNNSNNHNNGTLSGNTPNHVHVSRRGSVEIQVSGNRNNRNNNQQDATTYETIEALRGRVRELEIELADEKVRANGAERERATSVRDRDAAAMDLERAERDRESALQTVKSSDIESDAVREASRRLEREVDLATRGKLAAERQLSDALVERDRAITSAERASKVAEQSRQLEEASSRQRDELLEKCEEERKKAEEANAEKERGQYREDELRRDVATLEQSRSQEQSKSERHAMERDTARAEAQATVVERDALRKRLEQSERERSFSMGDAHEAERQRDSAQAQVIAAIEDGERKEAQRRTAVARAGLAEEACVIAQRARKEAEEACRTLDAAESSSRIEAESERRQRISMTEQLKQCLLERDQAINNNVQHNNTAFTLEQENSKYKKILTQEQHIMEQERATFATIEKELREKIYLEENKLTTIVQQNKKVNSLQKNMAYTLTQLTNESNLLKQEMLEKEATNMKTQQKCHLLSEQTVQMKETIIEITNRSNEKVNAIQNKYELEIQTVQQDLAHLRARQEKEQQSKLQQDHNNQMEEDQKLNEIAMLFEKNEEMRREKENVERREEHEKRRRNASETEWRTRLATEQEDRVQERNQRDIETNALTLRITNQDNQLRECMQNINQNRKKEKELQQIIDQQQAQQRAQAQQQQAQSFSMTTSRTTTSSALATPMHGATRSGPTPTPRARVRIHRSGSIVIDNDQPIGLNGLPIPPTPGGVVGQGYQRSLSSNDHEHLLETLSSAENARDELLQECQTLRARLSLQTALQKDPKDDTNIGTSPNVERLHRLQEDMRRLQEETESNTVAARNQVQQVESTVSRITVQLKDKEMENDKLRKDITDLRSQILNIDNNKNETLHVNNEKLHQLNQELLQLEDRLTHAQHGQATAQSQLEAATKTLRLSRAKEQRMEREDKKSKERENNLMISLETISKKNAQYEITVHSLKERVRQLQRTNTSKDDSNRSETDALKSTISSLTNELQQFQNKFVVLENDKNQQVEHLKYEITQELNKKNDNKNNELNQELVNALRTELNDYQQLLDQERFMKNELEQKVNALENERQQLAVDMQSAGKN